MTQIALPFTDNADIPESHLYALRVCNSGNWCYKRSFYELKNQILSKYGHEADYDLQHIVKRCYSCDGKGNHERGQCWNCDKGVYSRKDVLLKRYIINGALFHKPIGELIGNRIKIFDGYEDYEYDSFAKFRYESFDGKIVSTITGLIKHEPVGLHPVWAYYYLLGFYDTEKLYKCIASDVKSYQTNTQHKLKKLLQKFSPLKAYAKFFEVKQEQLELIDDLPF